MWMSGWSRPCVLQETVGQRFVTVSVKLWLKWSTLHKLSNIRCSLQEEEKDCQDGTLFLFVDTASVDNRILFTGSFYINKWNLVKIFTRLCGTSHCVFLSSRKMLFNTSKAGLDLKKISYVSVGFLGNVWWRIISQNRAPKIQTWRSRITGYSKKDTSKTYHDRRTVSFLISALDGDEWSASRPGRPLPQGKNPRYPLDRRLGRRQSWSDRGRRKNQGSNPCRPVCSQTLYWLI
jgi:hypothetical protein